MSVSTTNKRRIRPMFGFQSVISACAILGRFEMLHTMRKGQMRRAANSHSSLAEQFEQLAA
jgi:transposase-like protein